MSAYTDFVALVDSYRADNPAQRDGQAHFNVLFAVDPDLADEIRGGPADPFHRDLCLPEFHKLVAARMGKS